jgi:thiazole synthase
MASRTLLFVQILLHDRHSAYAPPQLGSLTWLRRRRYDDLGEGNDRRGGSETDLQLQSTWRPIAEHRVTDQGTGLTAYALVGRSKSVESSVQITLNGERHEIPGPLSVAELLTHLGLKPEHVAVEVNRDLVTRSRQAERVIASGDVLEVVTLVGGGGSATIPIEPLLIGTHVVRSRLFVGTGKYATLEQMRDCLESSGADVVTVAVRRERLFDRQGRNLLDYLDPRKYTILPNTAGCFSAEDALRTARLGRELLEGLENPGADWVKLEVLADSRTLLPDPLATLEATRILVGEGFQVLCYTSDDPVMARRLKEAGAASVMPAGSPIGSGQGVLNPNNIRIILEDLKSGDPDFPVIVDAGVGTASDVAIAMELGCDGVLLNTGIAGAADPLRMAHAMRLAVLSGWLASGAGRIPRKLYATASSPTQGVVGQTMDLKEARPSR